MTNYADIGVMGSIQNVQNLVQAAFTSNKFNVSWESPTKGKAEKGSRGANIAFGALAQYYAVNFEIDPLGQEGAALRLYQANSGWAGGVIGAHRVKKQFDELYSTLTTWFKSQGVLTRAKMDKT